MELASTPLPEPVRTRPVGLFEGILGLNPEPLFMEVRSNKAGFESGLYELLESLVGGARKYEDLNEAEKAMLDRGVTDMAAARAPRPPPTQQPLAKTATAPVAPPKEEPMTIPTEDGQAPFWWLQ